MRAQLSSACATCCDFLATGLLFRYAGLNYVWSTVLGAVTGGAVNCAINYRWTFRGTSKSKKAVAWRYVVVWCGSMTFNAWGVALLVWLLTPAGQAVQLSMLMYCKVAVAILVAVLWNFMMQKYWVYKK